ncbi:hypothetical protein M2175_001230 [Bradyrhizobium elkanii]|uniref:hypothetical protein n=1 Tax=Bradyrhizobium TaxID=374 RepID=UPI002169B58C|nr:MULTISPECIES: hypothetical protein [Bradyrhizobium]MCS3926199.1 hypothetical protein [Bradyrhizobium elkanii]MCS3966751.1 hypothetical protein [Bradyrhizobium japonicum]
MTTNLVSSGTTTLSSNSSNNYLVYGSGALVIAASVMLPGQSLAGMTPPQSLYPTVRARRVEQMRAFRAGFIE